MKIYKVVALTLSLLLSSGGSVSAFDGYGSTNYATKVRDILNESLSGYTIDDSYLGLPIDEYVINGSGVEGVNFDIYNFYESLYGVDVLDNGKVSCVLPVNAAAGKKLSFRVVAGECSKQSSKVMVSVSRSLALGISENLKITLFEYSGKGARKSFVKEDIDKFLIFLSSFEWMNGKRVVKNANGFTVLVNDAPNAKRSVTLDKRGKFIIK